MFNSRNVEGQAAEPSLKKRISFGTKFKLLLVAGLVGYNIWDWKKSTPKASKTQPTSETPPTTTAPATSGTPPTTTAASGTSSTPTAPVPSSSGTSPPAASQQLIYEGSTTDPTLLTKPAQDIARREERSPGHHPHADIPGEFHPWSRLEVVVDCIVTTAGNLEARSFAYNIR